MAHPTIAFDKPEASQFPRTSFLGIPNRHNGIWRQMTQIIHCLVLFGLLFPNYSYAWNFRASPKQDGQPTNHLTVAIIGFENNTGDLEDPHWRIAADTLISGTLGEVKAIHISPGVSYALRQVNKKEGDPIDEAEARKIGELIEAQRVVWGDYQRQGTKWLVKARVLNVATGKVSKEFNAASVDWFEVRDKLLPQILKQLGIKPTSIEQQTMARRLTGSSAALEWLCKAALLKAEGNSALEVEEYARRALEADPKCAEAYCVLAKALGTQGKMEEAEKTVRESLKLRPDYAHAHVVLGNLLVAQQKSGDAEDELSEAARLDPDDADTFALLGMVYEERDKDMLAVISFKKAARLDPLMATYHAQLGLFFARSGEQEKAMPELKLAEQLAFEDDFNTERFLCQAYQYLHKVPSAIEHYEAFVRIAKKRGANPVFIEPYEKTLHELKSSLTPVYVTAKMPREYALIDFTNALREKLTQDELVVVTNPLASTPEMDRWAHKLTAGATNELQKAQMIFDMLIRHVDQGTSSGSRTAREVFDAWNQPGQSFSCQEYACFYVALARAVGLKAFYVFIIEGFDGQRALHACAGVVAADNLLLIDPTYCWFGVPHKRFAVLDDLQTTAVYLSQQSVSLTVRRIACKITPDSSVTQFNLFFCLAENDQWKEASKVLPNALRLEPDGPMASAARGLWALHEGKLEEAINFLQNSVELDPTQAYVWLFLADAYVKESRLREARDVLRVAIRCGLPGENAGQARHAIAQINEKIGAD